ncbi:LacI family DNA-binding transcriptional regulator [Cereibacter sphaeroides]|uniref:LacI family DNA-binding transcriptional regulator n=1 Tax=Cereibacter sphaeroides TaxID=1063 RepID=UPI001F2B3C66|nr:LacI family DNA-binding transcriptional regulator [Cereibacter sphaeroides]MCE6951325.1 LacI family DNA-binding transcriptional regulator [Cereibacter sphaeroides]
MSEKNAPGPASRNAARRTTIYDLAALAGTSASAVSAVLNGTWKKRRISERLAERVMRVAEEQGYSVNLQASVLRRDKSNIIGMIMPKYDNRYFGAIAEQFEARARARGLFPVITCTQRDPDLEFEAAREMVSYQVECLIATGATDPDRISDFCASAGVTSINLDLPGSRAPSVVSDNFGGARDLTHLLLDRLPSQPLLFIGGRPSDHNTAERIRGFRAAHADRDISLPAEAILACGYAAEKAEAALSARGTPLPRGLFVNSTITLEGVVRWLRRQSPAPDVQIGAFDWDPFAALLSDCVGMVEQDVARMLEEVFRLIGTRADPQLRIEVPTLLRRHI